jgi:uncharacterized membrane protein
MNKHDQELSRVGFDMRPLRALTAIYVIGTLILLSGGITSLGGQENGVDIPLNLVPLQTVEMLQVFLSAAYCMGGILVIAPLFSRNEKILGKQLTWFISLWTLVPGSLYLLLEVLIAKMF